MRLRELQISYRTVTHTPAGQRPQIVTAKDAVGVVAPLLAGKIVEHFGVLSLDTRHRVVAWDVVSVGTLDATVVHPREVFLIAILHHAAALIVVHNHPSGDPSPSPDDITLSRRLGSVANCSGSASSIRLSWQMVDCSSASARQANWRPYEGCWARRSESDPLAARKLIHLRA